MQLRYALAVIILVGCGAGSAPPPAPSASPPAPTMHSEATLLASLPAGNAVLFGGNYMRMQDYLQSSPFAKLLAVVDAASPGMHEWTRCWAGLPIKMLGAVQFEGDRGAMRFVMSGVDIATIAACGERAGYPVSIDPDRKFISFEMKVMQNTVKAGYLLLPSGVLYAKQMLALGQSTPEMIGRAGLEADAATVARGTAANDTVLVAQLGGIDRTKSMWFVGAAANTPLAAYVGTFSGGLDFAPGLRVDLTVQITDAPLANKIAETIAQLKQQASALGPSLGPAVEQMQFERSGERLRMSLALDDAQLSSLADQLSGVMGAAAK